jgi:hypothetical protein
LAFLDTVWCVGRSAVLGRLLLVIGGWSIFFNRW